MVISMGCEVACPYIGRTFDDNWSLPDQTGKDDAEFRKVINAIELKLKQLAADIP